MLRIFDPLRPDRITRREALFAGAFGTAGLALPHLLATEARFKPARSKSVILIVPWGGPAQLDTLDLKPDASSDIRGEFKPIATRVTGIRISEHLPKLAARADRFAIIRSVTHKITTHNSATHYFLTGHPPAILNRELVPASRSDWPCAGSVLARMWPTERTVPSYVQLPLALIDNGIFSGGQTAGFWGTAYDPFVVTQDPSKKDFEVNGLALQPELSADRLAKRRNLLGQLEKDTNGSTAATRDFASYCERAYGLLGTAASKQAFYIHQEPAGLRESYGMNRLGQSMLLARRLVEAGVRLVLVSDTRENTNGKWDTHNGTYHDGHAYAGIRKQLPETDTALAALLDDLGQRGLLETTVVAWMAEFGRSPKINERTGGRDHWPHCYSLLLAGGGIRGGRVVGSSDRIAAHPRDNPVSPEDILATIYQTLGLPPHMPITDPLGRSMALCDGQPIRSLVGA